MATAPEITNLVSQLTGVPQSTAETIFRRLGEHGLIPRGTRGRRPADLSSKDLARMLIALMSVVDGIEGSAARVGQAVERIGRLPCLGASKVSIRDSAVGLDSTSADTFLDELSVLIERCADPDDAPKLLRIIGAVGLTFCGEATFGWIEITQEAEPNADLAHIYTRDLGGGRRQIFGPYDKRTMPGMFREARLSLAALAELATVAFPGSATSGPAGDD